MNYTMNKLYRLLIGTLTVLLSMSCQKFLDVKSDQSLVIPQKLDDLQAILDGVNFINAGFYPSFAEISSDDYYLEDNNYLGVSELERSLYRWDPYPFYDLGEMNGQWGNPYGAVMRMNLVLEELKKLEDESVVRSAQIRATARFLRAFSFQLLADVFSVPFQIGGSNEGLGIALRTSTDVEVKTQRSTVKETYDFIINELQASIDDLPYETAFQSQPTKKAAHALLARTYLIMGEYDQALEQTTAIFKKDLPLMNYGDLSKTSSIPIHNKNEEIIFYAYSFGRPILHPSRAIVSPELINLYEPQDLRLSILFNDQSGRKSFKGGYHGQATNSFFSGLANDEVYLIHAECLARLGRVKEAMVYLNQLRAKRFEANNFVPVDLGDRTEALRYILDERRRELLFRGLRWSDLRRLNQQPEFSKVLRRSVKRDGTVVQYELPPNDLRYTATIPQQVIALTSMPQTPR